MVGNIEHRTKGESREWQGIYPLVLIGQFTMTWDANNVYLCVNVTDDIHYHRNDLSVTLPACPNVFRGTAAYMDDSIQIAIADASRSTYVISHRHSLFCFECWLKHSSLTLQYVGSLQLWPPQRRLYCAAPRVPSGSHSIHHQPRCSDHLPTLMERFTFFSSS